MNNLKVTTTFSANVFDAYSTNTVFGNGSRALTLTGSANQGVSQSIATNWQRIPTGSVTSLGWLFLKNLETASYSIDIARLSASVTCSFSTLAPTEFCVFPAVSGSVFIARGSPSASVLQVALAPT